MNDHDINASVDEGVSIKVYRVPDCAISMCSTLTVQATSLSQVFRTNPGTIYNLGLSQSLIANLQLSMKEFELIATRILLLAALISITIALPSGPLAEFSEETNASLFSSIRFDDEQPPYDIFERGMIGFRQLKANNRLSEKDIITLIDFRKSANEKRLWVINLKEKVLLNYSLVAHGRNSGELFATKFSNTLNSHQSSLGFYVTGSKYYGAHGLSLRLHGMEEGINDNAESRAIVMHRADYVSERFISTIGRLGRSFGCPALPNDNYKDIINELADGTCLLIYYPDAEYLSLTEFR